LNDLCGSIGNAHRSSIQSLNSDQRGPFLPNRQADTADEEVYQAARNHVADYMK